MTDQLGRAAARGAGVTVVAQGVRFLLQFGSTIALARLLTPSDFGLVAMVTSLTGVAEIIRDFGLSSAAIQARTLSKEERSNLFWVNLGIGSACAIVIATTQPLIVRFYNRPALGPIVFSLAWLFIVSGANTQFRAELRRGLRFRALAFADVMSQVLSVAVAIAMAALGYGYWAIVCQQITLVVVAFGMNVVNSHWRPSGYTRGLPMRKFFRYASGVLGTQVLGYTVNNVDNVAIGATWGSGPLGAYTRAYQLLMVPINQINSPLSGVVLPVLSQVQDEPERFQRYLHRAQLVNAYLLGLVFAVGAALAGPIVTILFGPRWSDITPVFVALAVGGVFRSLTQLSYWIFLALGLTTMQLKQYLWTRPVMIALILAGLPWGITGVAIGHSVAFAWYWYVALRRLNGQTGVDAQALMNDAVRCMTFVIAPCAAAAYAGSRVTPNPWLQIAAGLTAAATCLGVVAVLSRSQRKDLGHIVRAVRGAVGA